MNKINNMIYAAMLSSVVFLMLIGCIEEIVPAMDIALVAGFVLSMGALFFLLAARRRYAEILRENAARRKSSAAATAVRRQPSATEAA